MAIPVASERVELSVVPSARRPTYEARALSIWPRLDPVRLRRTKGDPHRIARLVESRTALSFEEILGILGVATRR